MSFAIMTKNKDTGKSEVKTVPVTLIVAAIAIVPPFLEVVLDRVWTPTAQKDSHQLELKKFDLERDREAASLFREALSDPDSAQRKRMLKFLVAADLLEIDTEALLREEVPQWPAGPEESP